MNCEYMVGLKRVFGVVGLLVEMVAVLGGGKGVEAEKVAEGLTGGWLTGNMSVVVGT